MAAPEKTKQKAVKRPNGPKTGRIWAIADALTVLHLRPAKRKEVLEWTEKEGLDPSTANTQFSRWKNYKLAEETAALEEEYKDDDSYKDRFTDDWGTRILTYEDSE